MNQNSVPNPQILFKTFLQTHSSKLIKELYAKWHYFSWKGQGERRCENTNGIILMTLPLLRWLFLVKKKQVSPYLGSLD